MKKEQIFKIIKISSVVLSIFNLLMFFAMRCCWSGISKTLEYEKSESWFILQLPVILCVVFLLVAIINTTLYFIKNKDNKWPIILGSLDLLFLIAIIVIIALGAIDYMRFIWVEFFKSLAVVGVVLFILFLLFIYPKTKLKDSKVFKLVCLGALVISTIGYLVNFSINSITYKPVVYAVEDTYQIVFSSNSYSLGWVEIDGIKYHDLNAGSQKSFTKVHKISVPMEKLDGAKSYSIHCQKMIYRGPFGGIKGKELVQDYSFRPVDSSDGINYFSLADVHMDLKSSKKTASFAADMEFLVLNGDIISMIDTFADANYHNKVAHALTKGEIPVVYARGNHEIKGKMAEEFYKFTGAVNTNFYYNFYLDGIYGLVLDIGEDHDDDYWEYYGTANYEKYRNEQIKLLEKEVLSKEFEKYDYRMVVCHIPIVYVNSRKNHEECKARFTELLNQMNINIALSGHQHDLLVFEPNTLPSNKKLPYNTMYKNGTFKGYVTDYNFPNLLVSKRGYTQTDSNHLTKVHSQIGLNIKVDLINQKQTCTYINSDGGKVNIVNPFVEGLDYGEDIVISLLTNKFE